MKATHGFPREADSDIRIVSGRGRFVPIIQKLLRVVGKNEHCSETLFRLHPLLLDALGGVFQRMAGGRIVLRVRFGVEVRQHVLEQLCFGRVELVVFQQPVADFLDSRMLPPSGRQRRDGGTEDGVIVRLFLDRPGFFSTSRSDPAPRRTCCSLRPTRCGGSGPRRPWQKSSPTTYRAPKASQSPS